MQGLRPRATLTVAILTLTALLVGATTTLAAPVDVTLRIEGKDVTHFEGPVRTDVRPVDGHDGSGPRTCDGTNGGAGGAPSPTAGTALADGSEGTGGFSFVAKYFPPPGQGSDDFMLQTVNGETPDFNADQTFWGFFMNGNWASAGMCQTRVQLGDEILFARLTGSETLLRLTGPGTAATNQPVTFAVTDASNGSPVAGATVAGQTTGGDGKATVTFDSAGTRSFKATRANAVRSNASVVCIYATSPSECAPPTAGTPGTGASQAGVLPDGRMGAARILGIRDGQRFAWNRAPRLVRGATDPGAAGVHAVRMRLRRQVGRRCWFYSARSERLRRGSCRARHFFYTVSDRADWSYLLAVRPPSGRYVLDVTVMDRWGRVVADDVRFSVAPRPRR